MQSKRERIMKYGCAMAMASVLLCGGSVYAASGSAASVVEITDPGLYAGQLYSCTLTPTIEWNDNTPITSADTRRLYYQIRVGEFMSGTYVAIWSGRVASVIGRTDYSTTYSGPALAWDEWYYMSVTEVWIGIGTGPRVTTATDSDIDFFYTAEMGITYIDASREVVTIENAGAFDIDMTDWRLTDYNWSYYFPSFTLGAGQTVEVHVGAGTDTATDLYWRCGCADDHVWNDDGDTGYLYDDEGELIDQYSY